MSVLKNVSLIDGIEWKGRDQAFIFFDDSRSAETQSSYLERFKNPNYKWRHWLSNWANDRHICCSCREGCPQNRCLTSHIFWKWKPITFIKWTRRNSCWPHSLETTFFSQIFLFFYFLVNTYTLTRICNHTHTYVHMHVHTHMHIHTQFKHPQSLWRKASGHDFRSHCFLLGNTSLVELSSRDEVSHSYIINSAVYVPACLWVFSIS